MIDSTKIAEQEIAALRNQIWRMRHPQAPQREELWPNYVEPKVSDLKGIATQRIYEWESDTTWFRAYEIELHDFTGFQYILDFTGTTNHEIQGTFGVNNQRVEANLQPFELETICLVSRNKLDPFKFAVKMQWVTTDVHPAILETALAMNSQRIRQEWELQKQAGVTGDEDSDETDEIKAKLSKAGLRYVDTDWYPDANALYIEGEKSDKLTKEQVMWRRAGDFCKNPAVFKDGIDPEDILQGRLGDCWFCCSLASMAERPELITKIFVTDEMSPVGIFEVFFYHNGIKKTIILDDYFPCKPYSGPIYTKTGDDELWVAILEKAYAQLYGCYERLVSGTPYHAFTDLTGNPTELYDLSDNEHTNGLWEKLLAWNRSEENLMSAACEEAAQANPEEAGLMMDHSYTILDAKIANGYPQLLQIRNPWGHGEWKGDWSDFSPLWTEAAKKAYGINELDPDDGSFWMDYKDFLKYFTSLTVCHARKDWKDARIGLSLEFDIDSELLKTQAISLNVPNGGEIKWISIYQQDDREENANKYIDLSLLIFEDNGNGSRKPIGFIGMETARQVHCQFEQGSFSQQETLPAGNYLLVPYTSGRLWDDASPNVRNIAVSCHCVGSQPSLKIIDNYDKNSIDQVLLEMVMQMGDEKMWHDLERRHLRIGQMDVYCGRNNSQNKILTFSMSGDLDNIVNACGYPDLSQGCQFEMMPGQCAIFGVQVMSNPKEAGSSAYKFGLKSKAA